MFIVSFLRRAFVSNLRTVSAGDGERVRLEAVGISEPRVQGYFAWRRSLMGIVVIATSLSAGLVTYRDRTETEVPSPLETFTENLIEKIEGDLPVHDVNGAVERA